MLRNKYEESNKKNALENTLNGQTGVRKAYFTVHVNNFLKKNQNYYCFLLLL